MRARATLCQNDGVRILLSSTVPPLKEHHDSKQRREEDSQDNPRLELASGRITKHTDDSPAACETRWNTLANPDEHHQRLYLLVVHPLELLSSLCVIECRG